MSPVRRSPPPSDPPLSDQTFDELSEVRQRPEASPAPPPVAPAPAAESRAARIERKLRMARVLLADLPPLDERARLLHIAIIRRDEVLIDGILGALQAQRVPTPIGALASQIARHRHSSGIRPAYRPSEPPAAAAQGDVPQRSSTLLPPPRDDGDD